MSYISHRVNRAMDFEQFQQLSEEHKLIYIDNILKTSIESWYDTQQKGRATGNIYFVKEFATKHLDKFLEYDYEKFIHFFLYEKLNNNVKEIEVKKDIVDILIKQNKIKINGNLNKIPFLHIAAVKNDSTFLEYLVSLGAKTNKIDEDNDSFASSTLCSIENISGLKFAINQPDFNPLRGENILHKALNRNFTLAIDLILKSPLIKNNDFINNAREHENFDSILPYYEKLLLETTNIEAQDRKTTKKQKI
jgi:hypothetical protein